MALPGRDDGSVTRAGGRVRLLRLRSSAAVYGPERGFLEQAAPLRECGVDAELAALFRRRPGSPAVHPIVADAHRVGLTVHQLPDAWRLSPSTVVRVAGLLRRGSFDILQTHGYKADLVGRMAAALSRRHLVAVLHGLHTADSPRLRAYDSLDFRVLRGFELLIAVSEFERQRALGHRIPPSRVVTIHNAIDVAAYAERARQPADLAELAIPPGAGLVAIIGRLDPLKDHATFLGAAALVARQRPTTRFLVIGDGPLRDRFQALARELGIAASVHFLGYRADCPALIGRADLVALSSIAEPFGYVLIEAMAAARPVVATRAGGAPEVVEDGRTGLLVPSADPAALAAGMLRVLADPGLAAAWGEAGRRRAEQLFDVRTTAPRLAELYRAVAAEPVPTRGRSTRPTTNAASR